MRSQKPLNTLERQKKIERRAKRAYAVFACLMLSMAVMIVPAFAADDPLQIVENLSEFIFSLIPVTQVWILSASIVRSSCAASPQMNRSNMVNHLP